MQPKSDEYHKARALYLETGMNNKQIAAALNIHRKTVGKWINKGDWYKLKLAARQAPGMLVQALYNQFGELTSVIAAREEGNRYPTLHEAEVIRKLVISIKQVKQFAPADYINMFMEFLGNLATDDLNLTQLITDEADKFISNKMFRLRCHYPDPLPEKEETYETNENIETKKNRPEITDSELQIPQKGTSRHHDGTTVAPSGHHDGTAKGTISNHDGATSNLNENNNKQGGEPPAKDSFLFPEKKIKHK